MEKQEKVFLKRENCICKCIREEKAKYFLVTTDVSLLLQQKIRARASSVLDWGLKNAVSIAQVAPLFQLPVK